jgi:hypothetical protein
MTDLLYLGGTVGFFALMLAYVAGCRRLGTARVGDGGSAESRP